MSKRYMDWTDWAGDHPEQAEADLRAEREKAERKARLAAFAKVVAALNDCEHEDVSNQGVCTDCGDAVEGWEPSDAQIPGTYEIQGSAA